VLKVHKRSACRQLSKSKVAATKQLKLKSMKAQSSDVQAL
jgi:hypothetical protein